MTMTLAQGPSMNSLKKAQRIKQSRRVAALPTTYAALVDEHGVEIEITDAQIRKALDAMEDHQQFPYASRQTARGRWVASKAPARQLHS